MLTNKYCWLMPGYRNVAKNTGRKLITNPFNLYAYNYGIIIRKLSA